MLETINQREQTTVVLITHNLAQARRVCDRCLFLKDGELVEEGSAEELLLHPRKALTAKFIAGELRI